ncbi:putative serine esterase-domain-containing protein [Nemania sp. FL0916]|nr:putative serine esterase-domain-containing protein [Nemania sp. FL0916]
MLSVARATPHTVTHYTPGLSTRPGMRVVHMSAGVNIMYVGYLEATVHAGVCAGRSSITLYTAYTPDGLSFILIFFSFPFPVWSPRQLEFLEFVDGSEPCWLASRLAISRSTSERLVQMMEFNGGGLSADHLCVLVHGLWGNPNHMNQVAKTVRATYPEDRLYLLLAKRNSDYYTYDGIELGGERVCLEIEEEIEAIRKKGGNVAKLSIVGYSLGGLVARYAIGLLYAKGVLDKVEPMNFTTFATPHLGVRMPLRGWYDSVWNRLGARILSESGRQLFIVDKFRETGRPLLSILADPDSIFIAGLKKFKRRALYSNIINDRTVLHYTSMITKTDPYRDLARVKVNYAHGYEDVVLDQAHPVSPLSATGPQSMMSSVAANGLSYVKNGPLVLALAVILPIGITAFLLNSVVQTVRSSRRIQRHENGQAGIQIEKYRMPIWMKELQGAVEDVYENLNSSQKQAYLTASDDDGFDSPLDPAESNSVDLEHQQSQPHLPTLALAPCQFDMITALDSVGWRKHPVWIHKVRHSHAAIIVRAEKPGFSEGYIVLKHWLDREFLI